MSLDSILIISRIFLRAPPPISLVCAADQDTIEGENDSFSLANIVPETPEKSRHNSKIEKVTRVMAKKKGELYVITGPIFIGPNVQRIGGRVLVPTMIFKAIYDPSTDQAAAYIIKNDNAPNDTYRVISITQLEQMSGIIFFQS